MSMCITDCNMPKAGVGIGVFCQFPESWNFNYLFISCLAFYSGIKINLEFIRN